MMRVRIVLAGLIALSVGCVAASGQQRMVVIDQDGSGPGGSNQMAMMVLLQSPRVKVLGITMVSGNAWGPEEVQHTLRMLELIGRTDVPVAAGAVYPLVRTQEEAMLEKATLGRWDGMGRGVIWRTKRAGSHTTRRMCCRRWRRVLRARRRSMRMRRIFW